MRPSYLILLVVFNCFWAATLSMYKALAGSLEPGGIVTMRFGLAAVLVAVCWPWLPGKTPRGRDFFRAALMGLLVFMVGQRLQVYGNKLGGSAGNSAVLMGAEPLVTSVAAALFLREHIGPRRWTGFLLGMLGVALLNGLLRKDFQWAGLGASLIFMSSFAGESAYSVIGKPMLERAGVMKILGVGLIAGTIGNLLIDGRQTILAARVMPANCWWMVIYMATICSAIGYAVWFFAIRETDVNLVAMTIFVQPLAGLAIAALWLHEPLHLGQLWGSLAIVAGLVWGLSRQIKPAVTSSHS
jgi:drug/metabolite transporter (DMT)-like permease